MPKKTVAEFKAIFAPVKKKPPRPSNVTAEDKDLIEADVSSSEGGKFKGRMMVLAKTNRQYAIDLIAYKVGKHIDDSKLANWVRDVDEDLMKAAATKMIPRDLSDDATLRQFRKAQQQKNVAMLDLFNRRDPEGANRIEAQDTAVDLTKKLGDAFDKNDAQAAETLGLGFDSVIKHGDPVAMAKANPKLFFESVLKGFKESVAQFTEAFAKPELREALKKACPAQWKDFAAASPMLATLEKAEATAGKHPSDEKMVDGLFDAILDPTAMPLTYSATMNGFRTIDILAGPTKSNAQALTNAKKITGAPGPATDCHNLQNLTLRLLEAKMGNSVKRSVFPPTNEELKADVNAKGTPKGKAKGMVLTRKLSDIGTKGLIGSFQGNVFDEGGNPTGKVFFTGDASGQDSHSWLVVTMVDKKDGKTKEMSFDPVLGTKGAEVERAIDEQSIVWANGDKTVAKTPGGSYLIRVADKDCGPNQIGVTSYYTVTKTAPKDLG